MSLQADFSLYRPGKRRATIGLLALAGLLMSAGYTYPQEFTDHPLIPGVTSVKAIHFGELRARIDRLRTSVGLSAFPWADEVLSPGVTPIRDVHLRQLRQALDETFAAMGRPRPVYSDRTVTAGVTVIRAAHLTELRTLVVDLWRLIDPANRSPQASGSVPAQTLRIGDGDGVVDVARYFRDPDGDPLTYTAASGNPDIVAASVSAGTVVLAPRGRGAATVTIAASDPGGLEATHAVDVTVFGEPAQVMVRVVRVTPDWHGYVVRGGWPAAVPIKESDVLKFFEIAIWEETKSIHFYEFDNDFDPLGRNLTPEQLTTRRESYAILRVDGMPDPWTSARSRFIVRAFGEFTSLLSRRYPDSEHHLMYHGHGGPGGRLFDAQLTYRDAHDLLAHWTRASGRALGVIDMGGPCNKGSFSDLENFCRHARYYVASDLPNGGFTMDDWTIEKYNETHPELQYHALFTATSSLEKALIGRIDLRRQRYEYSRNNMTESRTQQANYLYSCRVFEDFGRAFRTFLADQDNDYDISDDLYDYMVTHGAGDDLLARFGGVFVHRADNRDFFEWEPGANGMLMPGRTQLGHGQR